MSVDLNNSLKGLEIQAAEPSGDASVSGSKSDISVLEDESSILEGKRVLHGSIISKTGTGLINAITAAPYCKEGGGVIKADSIASSVSPLGGGVALPNNADRNNKRESETIGEGDDRGGLQNNHPFFTIFDNEGYAHLRQADRLSSGGKSVSEFSEASKGGWGKVKVMIFIYQIFVDGRLQRAEIRELCEYMDG